MNIVNMIVKFLLKFTLFTMSATRILFKYLEKETIRTLKEAGPSGSVPVNNDMLNAAAANAEEGRRKALEAEKRAQQAAERARQTQHQQDRLRAAQARADADRARNNY